MRYAVLAHLVRHPGYGYKLRDLLAEELDMPRLSKTTVYRALEQLQRDGLAEEVGKDKPPGAGRSRVWFQATEKGVHCLEEWLRTAASKVTILDELHSKLLVSRPENLPELIEATWEQERASLALLEKLKRDAEQMPGDRSRNWRGITWMLVRNNEIAHLQVTSARIQRTRSVLERLRDDRGSRELS